MGQVIEAARKAKLHRLYATYADVFAQEPLRAGDNPLVPGTGSLTPRLMFVGEAPGRQEQAAREPFIGASGKFLNEMLASVGLSREEVFITNAVKYRPTDEIGNNRPPSEKEVGMSLGTLRAEHKILGRPPMVMLGKHARRSAERGYKLPMGLTIGEWFWMGEDSRGFPMLPLYHPAYGIYQRANRPLMLEQFKAVLTPPTYQEVLHDAF